MEATVGESVRALLRSIRRYRRGKVVEPWRPHGPSPHALTELAQVPPAAQCLFLDSALRQLEADPRGLEIVRRYYGLAAEPESLEGIARSIRSARRPFRRLTVRQVQRLADEAIVALCAHLSTCPPPPREHALPSIGLREFEARLRRDRRFAKRVIVATSRARASIVEPLPEGPSDRLLLEQGFDVLEADAKAALGWKTSALPHLNPWRKSRLRSLALNNLLATEPRIADPAPRAGDRIWRRHTPELLAPRRLILIEGPLAEELGVALVLGAKEPDDLERLFAVVWQLSVSEASDQAREVVEIFADSVRRFRGPDTARWTRLAIQEQHRIYTDVGDRRFEPAFRRATAFVGAAFEILPDYIDALVMARAYVPARAALNWYREHLPNMNQWLNESGSTSGLHPRDVELTLLASEARVARGLASANSDHSAMAAAMAATNSHDEITRIHLDKTGEHPIDRVRSLQLVIQTALQLAAVTNDSSEKRRAVETAVSARAEREELVSALRLPVAGNKRAEFKHAARFAMLDHALARAIGDQSLAWSTQSDALALAAAHERSFPVLSRALRRLGP